MKKDESEVSKEGSLASIQRTNKNKKRFVILLVVIAFFLIFAIFVNSLTEGNYRSESYKKVNGTAGLNATIVYECDKKPCSYDFNVYILASDGQQVGAIRPDKDGRVNAALPSGKYVLLIGKRFGNDAIFPQEPVELKNGQALELKLHYK